MKLKEKERRLLVFIILLLAGFYFLYLVRGILFPFLLAGVIAYLVNPLIEKLLQRGFTRVGAIVLLFSILLTVCLIFGIFGIPAIVEELNRLSQTLPNYVRVIQERLDTFYQEFQRIKLPDFLKQMADQALEKAEKTGLDFVNRVTGFILDLFSHLLGLFMAPFIAYYLLKDREILSSSILNWLPLTYQDEILQVWKDINGVISGFFRGQFIVALLVSVCTTIGLAILKVNFAVVLGVVAGLFNVIPYIGSILGAVPAVVIVLIKSPWRAVAVILLFIFIQQVEGAIIAPRIMGNQVGLHPLTVIFAVLAGGQLAGIVGMILAVPVAGVVKVILKNIFFP